MPGSQEVTLEDVAATVDSLRMSVAALSRKVTKLEDRIDDVPALIFDENRVRMLADMLAERAANKLRDQTLREWFRPIKMRVIATAGVIVGGLAATASVLSIGHILFGW